MGLNFNNVNDAVKAQQANRGVGFRRLDVKDGETVRVRLIGDDTEPFQMLSHYVKRIGPNGRPFTCSAHGPWKESFPGCACCHFGKSDAGIASPQPRFLFSVISDRRVHEHTVMEGNTERKRCLPCLQQSGQPCDMCASGLPQVREGRKYMELATKYARGLITADANLSKRCASCEGLGELKVVGHECSYCGEGVAVPVSPNGQPMTDATIRCPSCSSNAKADPKYTCSRNCAEPRPRNIQDCWVDVTRTGSGQSTNFTFTPQPPTALEGDDPSIQPWDFSQVVRPKDQSEIAQTLGYQSPWAPVPQYGGHPQQPQQGYPQQPVPQQPQQQTVAPEVVWQGAQQTVPQQPPFQAPPQAQPQAPPMQGGGMALPQTNLYQGPPQGGQGQG